MNKHITIIYAYRNRDIERVNLSLQTLMFQTKNGFEVVFVDYGSEVLFSQAVKEVVNSYDFAHYHYVGHSGLLWNKSKALNYGIKYAKGDYIFIADVDILFHPNTIQLFQKISSPEKSYLFKLSYLSKKVSQSLRNTSRLFDLPVKHHGKINGMVLTSKSSLTTINGLDEFFHFYGSEDMDLANRLEISGQQLIEQTEEYFLHQWHTIYNSYDDSKLSITPRLFNIKRINQEHYFYNKDTAIVKPINSVNWGKVIENNKNDSLSHPDVEYQIINLRSKIVHFLGFLLPSFENGVIKIEVREDKYQHSLKYRLKKILKKVSQPYISIKDVNDLILSEIIFKYRDNNYFYKVHNDLKGITFIISRESNEKKD